MSAAILFKGEKIGMNVNAWGLRERMIVQPGVAVMHREMGVFVWLFREGDPDKLVVAKFWGLVMPQDLIACWRAMLILQGVKNLSEDDLRNAYCAGQRESYGDCAGIIAKIGRGVYDAVMTHPIPDEVVNYIIRFKKRGTHFGDRSYYVVLWPITQEVEAGTFRWRDDFACIGVKHPWQAEDRRGAERRVIERYDRYITDYARKYGYFRKGLIMQNVERVIVDMVERGVEARYGQDIVLGLAIMRARGSITVLTSTFMSFGDENIIRYPRSVQESLYGAVRWLRSEFRTGFLSLKPERSQQEYMEIMEEIDRAEKRENMPITHPL